MPLWWSCIPPRCPTHLFATDAGEPKATCFVSVHCHVYGHLCLPLIYPVAPTHLTPLPRWIRDSQCPHFEHQLQCSALAVSTILLQPSFVCLNLITESSLSEKAVSVPINGGSIIFISRSSSYLDILSSRYLMGRSKRVTEDDK